MLSVVYIMIIIIIIIIIIIRRAIGPGRVRACAHLMSMSVPVLNMDYREAGEGPGLRIV